MHIGDNRQMAYPSSPPDLGINWVPATVDDAGALSVLYNEIAEHDDTPERLSADTMAHELESAFAPLDERTIVGRTPDGEIVAYGTMYHRKGETDEDRVYVATYVRPDHRPQLDEPLTDWAVGAGKQELATSASPRRFVCVWLYKSQQGAADRFRQRGFEPVRHWWDMERLLSDAVEPAIEDGFSVVPWEDGHNAATRLVHNAAFADHWGSVPMSKDAWQNNVLDSPGFRPDLSYIAIAEGEIAGYSYNEVYEEDWESAGQSEAWISALGVLRKWRKKGIATALLSRSMQTMRDAGLEAAMIGVDSSSPSGAQHLYQAVGFQTKTKGTTWQREVR